MKIGIMAPSLPPKRDGIGDYTANLVQHLKAQHEIVVFIPKEVSCTPIAGIEIATPFSYRYPPSVLNLPGAIAPYHLDWLLLQYCPFSYGRWGFNPFLPAAMQRVRNTGTHFAVVFHETYVPILNWKFAIYTQWQRYQVKHLWRASEKTFVTIEAWARQLSQWSGGPQPIHLPVGSNIPNIGLAKREARDRLKIPSGILVLGLFGTVHGALYLDYIYEALLALKALDVPFLFLYIGPNREEVCTQFKDVPVRADGLCSPEEVSKRLAAVDIYLSPYEEGLSTLRSSAMAAMAHGLPIVSTYGGETGCLGHYNGTSFLLAPFKDKQKFIDLVLSLSKSPPQREEIGKAALALFRNHFTWDKIVLKMLEELR